MPTPTRPAIKTPTLRDLSLDAIHALAMKLRAQDPSLTQAAAVTKAASSPEGREAYAFYVHPWSSLPWPQAVAKMDAATKAGAPRRKAPAAAGPAAPGPADVIYSRIVEEAVAGAAKGRSRAGAIADYLATSAGQQLWARYNAARRIEAE